VIGPFYFLLSPSHNTMASELMMMVEAYSAQLQYEYSQCVYALSMNWMHPVTHRDYLMGLQHRIEAVGLIMQILTNQYVI